VRTSNKIALCFTGTTCSGKTTYIDKLSSMFGRGAPCLNIGRVMRQRHQISDFAASDQPQAPVEMNAEVREILREFLDSNNERPLIAIESMPRNVGQVEELNTIRNMGFSVIVVVVDGGMTERVRRAIDRDSQDPADREALYLTLRKIHEEHTALADVIKALNGIGYPMIHMVTAE